MRSTQRIFANGPGRGVDDYAEFKKRMDRFVEREGLQWLKKAETAHDRRKVMEMYGDALMRYWTNKGYSQRWIAEQFG